jgi:Asp-tRNA(Asn)/Glu-tRNA(Gln) amidotransferase A subunit family amidase
MPEEFADADFFAPASDIAARIRTGKLSSTAVVEALTERIAKHNPTLNAFVPIALEENLKRARKEAEHADKMRKEHPGMALPPLYGVPVAVKDDLAVKGLPLTNGSRLCGTAPAEYEDITVTRLKEAGAIVLGKTQLPEFGHKGVTDNRLGPLGARLITATPWDTDLTAGGSSGGSAAAVAAGLAYLALGTDVGGSIRTPASCCGVVGHKPTFGVIPRFPSGNAFTLWVTGPLARTVGDVATAMQVLAVAHPADRFYRPPAETSAFDLAKPLPKGLQITWYASPAGQPIEPAVADAANTALRKWAKAARVRVVEPAKPYLTDAEAAELPGRFGDAVEVGAVAECQAAIGARTRRQLQAVLKQNDVSRTFLSALKAAMKADIGMLIAAQTAITSFCEERSEERFAGSQLIATPTLTVLPFDKTLDLGPDKVAGKPIDPDLGWFSTWPFNLTGEPAISIPAAWVNGLPVGLQLVARRGYDGLVLRVAAAIEKAVPWADRQPKL